MMDTKDLIRTLELEFAGIQADNPDWEMTLSRPRRQGAAAATPR